MSEHNDQPALVFDNVTVRFGGLTAVDGFSYEVPRGKICSIIGPNGAGKTTAFNVATGIYEPTEGRVLVQGREPERQFTWRVGLLCGVLGLLTGLALFLLTHNVDQLWNVAIKRNMADPTQEFSYGQAFTDGLGYLGGELNLQWRRGRWFVQSADGKTQLARISVEKASDEEKKQQLIAAGRAQAQEQLEGFETMIAHAGELDDSLVEAENRWQVQSPEGATLASFISKTKAEKALADTEKIAATRRTRGWLAGLLGVVGIALGAAGVWSIWSQSRRTPDVIMRGGIARTFQNIRLFRDMTVLENVLVGMERRFAASSLAMMLRTPGVRRAEKKATERAMELLRWVRLTDERNNLAKNLPYGAQRRLEIARALATKPRILLLDEPAAGMNPSEADELMILIRDIKSQGVTILLIEHHMHVVMEISDRIAVLDQGKKIAEGTPEEVRNDPKVIEAYLGKDESE